MEIHLANKLGVSRTPIREAIRKLEGVNSVTVSYIAQKFVLDAEDARFDEILQEAVKICRKVEPDCRIMIK